MNEIRLGKVVGEDSFGNTYYENNEYFFGRNRWVDYKRKDVDASQIPPEWHRWIHYITDDPPTKCPPVERKFHQSHVENLSGSDQEYVPYSTVVKKVHSWRPPQN